MFTVKLSDAFRLASEGIVYSISTQRNMKIHIFTALIILLSGMKFHLSNIDTIIILFSIMLVIAAELFNTAIETAVDLVTSEYHHLAKTAKDIAAGGVLFISVFVLFVGIIILFPYFTSDISRQITIAAFMALQGAFIFLLTYAVKSIWFTRRVNYQPDVLLGMLLYFFSFSSIFIKFLMYIAIPITLIYLFFLIKRGNIYLISLLQNVLISIGGVYILYRFFY